MTEKEKMIAGLPYKCMDPELVAGRARAHGLTFRYARIPPHKTRARHQLLKKLLGSCGEFCVFEDGFHCDYGYNIRVGNGFYANYNCIILDVAPVTIGNDVMFGPNVALYTASHPLHKDIRCGDLWLEFGKPITIGNTVWIGGNTVVNAGITIGDNCVIGSGSIVTHDIPANSLACGNPCRVLREITDADKEFYFKKERLADVMENS